MRLIEITPLSSAALVNAFTAAQPGAALSLPLPDGRLALLTLASLRCAGAADPPGAPQGAQAY